VYPNRKKNIVSSRENLRIIQFLVSVDKQVMLQAGVRFGEMEEPYFGWIQKQYEQGTSPELVALDIIEFNAGLGIIPDDPESRQDAYEADPYNYGYDSCETVPERI